MRILRASLASFCIAGAIVASKPAHVGAADNCQSNVSVLTPTIDQVCLAIRLPSTLAPTVVKTVKVEPTAADLSLLETVGRIEAPAVTAIAE